MINISSIYERIRILREKKGITQDELATQLGYTSRSSIAKIESGKTDITQSKVKELAEILNTTTSYLIDGIDNSSNLKNNNFINNNQITNDEKDLLIKFNKLNILGKNEAKKRVDELTQIEKYTIDNVSEELCVTRLDIKDIQLYEIPASAGTGMLITDDVPYEIRKIDLTIAPQARKADFALYVRGDSMEPSYYDGDIIFIKSQPAVDNGQIGIFIYDDESYIKKYSVQEDGVYLVSLNKKYEPIKIDENLNFKVCGLVL
ncbi:MAG: helix-turn-helix domain-containing protein [Clostridiales bacterium]|nr:helix-turn-helix domain-containing protein [Clostridiales bacterium]